MKKASKRKSKSREPSASALKEMPEVDFSTASVRSNPYAKKLAKTGIEIVIPGQDRMIDVVHETEERVRIDSVFAHQSAQCRAISVEVILLHLAGLDPVDRELFRYEAPMRSSIWSNSLCLAW